MIDATDNARMSVHVWFTNGHPAWQVEGKRGDFSDAQLDTILRLFGGEAKPSLKVVFDHKMRAVRGN